MSTDNTMKDKKKKRRKMYLRLEDGRFDVYKEYIAESAILDTLYRLRFHGKIYLLIEGKKSRILKKALEFSKKRGEIKKKYKNATEDTEKLLLQDELKNFDENFFQENQTDAFDLADAACRLEIKSLFRLMTRALADTMVQETPDRMRKIFDIYYHEDSVDNFGMLEKMVAGNAHWAFK